MRHWLLWVERTLTPGSTKMAPEMVPALRGFAYDLIPQLEVASSKFHREMGSWVAHARCSTPVLPICAVHDLLAILCLRSR
jgi:hypothetical protein